MDWAKTLHISAAAMKAQGLRLRTIAENIANADSLAQSPDQEPYRRKTVLFKNVLDRAMGINKVTVDKIIPDPSAFPTRHDPGHPAADRDGYVKLPNVSGLIELMDMRQAQRSYEGNLKAIEVMKSMLQRTIDILGA